MSNVLLFLPISPRTSVLASIPGSEIAVPEYSEGERAEASATLSDATIRGLFGAQEESGRNRPKEKGKRKVMAFGTFKSLGEVALRYQIALRQVRFLQPSSHPVEEHFQKRLEFYRENAPVSVSEEAISEFLIAPILQEIWISFSDALMIWSHVNLGKEPPLKGFPDYFFSRRSPLGRVLDQPYVLFIEAKLDDFDLAWAQCLAAMLAAQQMNRVQLLLIQAAFANVSG